MAVYSMTGYASVVLSDPALALELRSVNGRFLDLSFKVADELRHLEPALREALTAGFRRGKIDVRVAVQRDRKVDAEAPTPQQLKTLAALQAAVQAQWPQARELSVAEVLSWCRQTGSGAATDGSAMDDAAALRAFERGVHALRDSRAREGEKLVAILMERIAQLRGLATQAAPLIPAVVQKQQARFLERWHDALAATGTTGATGTAQTVSAQALQERALNEAAAFAIRIDVAEELSRLGAHLDEIERLLRAGGELGKRLDFLIQELHREANTLGSKSAALELTQVSVEMKVLIEQMREQVQNLE